MRLGLNNVTVIRKWTLRYKGSGKSGNYGHAGRPGKRGGSVARSFAVGSPVLVKKGTRKDDPFLEGRVIGAFEEGAVTIFEISIGNRRLFRSSDELKPIPGQNISGTVFDRYPDAPRPKHSNAELREFSRGDSYELYHVTLEENVQGIQKKGLVPAGTMASGQDWKADHSTYATYFHVDKSAALSNVRQADGLVMVKVRIPASREFASRILPDEDVSLNINDGLRALFDTSPIAIIGGVDPSMIVSSGEKSLSIRYRTKGSGKSGNYGHAGRPGKRGGSAPKSYVLSDISRNSGGFAAFYRSEFADWTKEISIDSKSAISDYTEGLYTDVNELLRFGKITFEDADIDDTKQLINDIDAAINSSSLVKEDTVVYRSVNSKVLAGIQVGDVHKDNGFASTSVGIDPAHPSISRMNIILPKGSKAGAYIEKLSLHPKELEWLLPRGSTFRVLEKTRTSKGQEIITLLWLGADPGAIEEKAFKQKPKISDDKIDKFTWKEGDLVLIKRNKKKSLSVIYRYKGSATSGNFGHSGRPGKRGGSAPKSYVLSDISRNSGNNVDEYRSEFADWKAGLDDMSSVSIEAYTKFAYKEINDSLRTGKPFVTDGADVMVDRIDSALESAPSVNDDMVVYRGMSAKRLKNLQPGDKYQDNGFVSTSVDLKGTLASDAQVNIILPKGSKAGAYVENVSAWPKELEWLLPRGSMFEVLKIEERTSFKKATWTLLYLGADPGPVGGKAFKQKSEISKDNIDKFTWKEGDLVLIKRNKKKSLSVIYRINENKSVN